MEYVIYSVSTFFEYLDAARRETQEYLSAKPEIIQGFDHCKILGYQTLLDVVPSDLEFLTKIGYYPFSEATTEIDYSINLALCGSYKSAYHHLRSFFELVMVGVYFGSTHVTEADARDWLRNGADTPFFNNMLRLLFRESTFQKADLNLGLNERIRSFYKQVCDIVHTKGISASHAALSRANFPRFVAESLERFLSDLKECVTLVYALLSLRSPIILAGLPMLAKFGLNPPMSGFLEEHEAAQIRSLFSPTWLTFLEGVLDADTYAQGAITHILSLPDLTDEEIDKQLASQKELLGSEKPL
jgi:hypothetical protein